MKAGAVKIQKAIPVQGTKLLQCEAIQSETRLGQCQFRYCKTLARSKGANKAPANADPCLGFLVLSICEG